jgi:hypothetical protein
MPLPILSGMVSLLLAIIFGAIAIRHWRAQQVRLADGMGLRFDRHMVTDFAPGVLIAAMAMGLVFLAESMAGAVMPLAAAAGRGPSILKAGLIMITAAFAGE